MIGEAQAGASPEEAARLLALPMPAGVPGDTGGQYLLLALARAWAASPAEKRWKRELYAAMVNARMIEGDFDSDGVLDDFELEAGDEIVAAAVKLLGELAATVDPRRGAARSRLGDELDAELHAAYRRGLAATALFPHRGAPLNDPGAGTAAARLMATADTYARTAGWHGSEDWCVFYGGPAPDECAGVNVVEDEQAALEEWQWRVQAGIAHRTVLHGPWVVTAPAPGNGSGCACYQADPPHDHEPDEEGDCVTCGCGLYEEPDEGRLEDRAAAAGGCR